MDPLAQIEDRKAQEDMGVMLARVYRGAYDDCGNRSEAFWATVAFFVAMLKHDGGDG